MENQKASPDELVWSARSWPTANRLVVVHVVSDTTAALPVAAVAAEFSTRAFPALSQMMSWGDDAARQTIVRLRVDTAARDAD